MATLWLITAGLLLLSCGCASSLSSLSFSSSAGRPSQSHDLNPKQMQSLLGQPVATMRMMERPLDGGDKIKGLVSHSGVEVVTKDGRRFLIHKGPGYGNKAGNTVVLDAKHMSKKWKPVSVWKVPNERIQVTDMVKAGGKDYDVLFANCHDASKNIMYGNKQTGFKSVYSKPQVPKEDRISLEGRKVEKATGGSIRKQEGRAGGSRRTQDVRAGGFRRGHEVSRRDHEVSRRGHDGSRRGHDGSRRGHDGSRRGHDGSGRGHDGFRRGHDGSRRGHDGSRRGHDGSRRGHDGSRRGHDGSRRGHDGSRGGRWFQKGT